MSDNSAKTAPIDPQAKFSSQAQQGPFLAGVPQSGIQLRGTMTGGVSGHPEINPLMEISAEQKADIEVIPESPEISPELAKHVEKVVRGESNCPGRFRLGNMKEKTSLFPRLLRSSQT